MPPPDFDARRAWDAGAEAYIAFVDSGADYYRHRVHGPGLLAACGDLGGRRVLDLGCGHGYFSRLLARAGADVVGIDLSEKLLARAVAVEAAEPLGIAYHHLDAAAVGTAFDPESFDRVTGCMSLQDMADPAAVLAAARRVLRPDGRVVVSVPHPATDLPVRSWRRDEHGRKVALVLDRYFDTGPAVCDWNMPRLKYSWRTPYHRFTLSEWSRLLADAGLTIRGLHEPRPDAAAVAACPDLDDCARMPYFLIFDLAKAG